MMHLIGYAGALLMGMTLGLVGSGGSLMTVPILVYLFHFEAMQATGYSLFVVGVASCFGALSYWRKGLLNYSLAALFVFPSFIAVYATRHWLIPQLPDVILTLGGKDLTSDIAFALTLVLGVLTAALILWQRLGLKGRQVGAASSQTDSLSKHQHPFENFLSARVKNTPTSTESISTLKLALLMAPAAAMVFIMRQWVIPALPYHLVEFHGLVVTRDRALMLAFSFVMAAAAYSMLRKPNEPQESEADKNQSREPRFRSTGSNVLIALQGLVVGLVTGLLGAGGGFLIVPALVLLADVPMKKAVGTSLMIITVNSLVGFMGDVFNHEMDWPFLLRFTGLAIAGIFIGTSLSDRISTLGLKRAFGYMVAILSVVVLITEIRS